MIKIIQHFDLHEHAILITVVYLNPFQLALLLHGSDESPHWSQAAPKHHPDYGT